MPKFIIELSEASKNRAFEVLEDEANAIIECGDDSLESLAAIQEAAEALLSARVVVE